MTAGTSIVRCETVHLRMLSLSSELRSVIRPGVLAFDGLLVVERQPSLDGVLSQAERSVRAEPPPQMAHVRAMYRAVGIDPTRRRPSSEALLRRVLGGGSLPRVNSLVDIGNWCSLEFQLPYGLYDLEHIRGTIQLRLGHEGEAYPGIRKDEVHVAGRLTLADDLGAFGNPSADSARTMVTPLTTRALVVVFAPFQLPAHQVADVLALTSARVVQHAGGVETARIVI